MAEILFKGKFLIFSKSEHNSGPVSGVIFSKKSPVDTQQTIQDSEAASGHTRCVLSFLLYFQMCLESELESGLATLTHQQCHRAWARMENGVRSRAGCMGWLSLPRLGTGSIGGNAEKPCHFFLVTKRARKTDVQGDGPCIGANERRSLPPALLPALPYTCWKDNYICI